jgi:hypothetical protein
VNNFFFSLSTKNSEIQLDGQGTRKIVNHDKLKPYNGDQNPKWMKEGNWVKRNKL